MIKTLLIRRVDSVFGRLATLATTLLTALCAVPAHAAICEFDAGQSTKKVTFTIPAKLDVPRDTPAGSVVWQSAIFDSGANPGNSFTCDTFWALAVRNEVGGGVSSSEKSVNPIGKTGLGWSLHYQYWELEGVGWAPNHQVQGSFKNDWVRMKLIIRKIGPVDAGASVPNGLIGYVSPAGAFNSFSIHTSNEASVGTLSCTTPSVVVKMGDQNRVGQFKGVGTSLAPVNFSITLKACPKGINKVSYLLKPNTEIMDAARSVVALDAASTAKGVGLQMLDGGGNPVALNKSIVFDGYDKTGGYFSIPLKAAYHQTGAVIEPGTANGSVAFVMTYD